MVNNGLEEEVCGLLEFKDLNPLKTVGYRELFDYFEGKISRVKAIELIKRNSRRYAKRQMTWWSKDAEIKWFGPEMVQDIVSYVEEVLKSVKSKS